MRTEDVPKDMWCEDHAGPLHLCWYDHGYSEEQVAAYRKRMVQEAINAERKYQDSKYGEQKTQTLPGWLLIIEREIEEAKLGWIKGTPKGRDSCLAELIQVATCAIRACEKFGTEGCD